MLAAKYPLHVFVLSLCLATTALAAPPGHWEFGNRWSQEADPTYQQFHNRGATPWITAVEEGGVVHLLFDSPTEILRYDTNTDTWLPEVTLPATPTAMAVDSDGIYVAFGADIRRYALDGSGEVSLYTAPEIVREMLVSGDYLFLITAGRVRNIHKMAGFSIDSFFTNLGLTGFSILPSGSTLYARTESVGPADISMIQVNPDGTLGSDVDSQYHGDYPSGVMTWTFPSNNFVTDNTGIVYSNSLVYAGSLAGPFQDLAHHAAGPILLRDGDLIAHDSNFLETGRHTLSEAVKDIVVNGDSIYGFYSSGKGVGVEKVAKASLVPPAPGEPLDPEGLAYTPDQAILGSDGIVYLLSKANSSIFRWSIAAKAYLTSIPLAEAPLFMAHSDLNSQLYLAYASGRLTQIDVSGGGAARGMFDETSFVNSPQGPCGLTVADPWIFVCDPTGDQISHFTYGPDGSLISQEGNNYFSLSYEWSPINSRIYHLRDQVIPNDIFWEAIGMDGVLGQQAESPLHSGEGMTHPIRVHPDGSLVLLGSGRYHDANTLDLSGDIGTAFVDARWLNGQLVTLQTSGEDSVLSYWDGSLIAVTDTLPVAGAPVYLFVSQGQLVVVTQDLGIPQFTLAGPFFTGGFEGGDFSEWSHSLGL